MSPFEFWVFWATVFAYAAGAALVLAGLALRRERLVAWSGWICMAGLISHLATVAARIAFTGHVPVASRYENVLTGSAVVMLFAVVSILRRRGLMPLLAFVAPFCLLMLGYALLNQPRYTTMSLVLDNLWLFVHILFAWLAYGAYSIAAALGVLYLLRARRRYELAAPDRLPPLMAKLPGLPLMDDLTFRFIILGFLAHVVMVASGSIWARDLWGSYWSWDPVETWSLASGLLYGLWIHLKLSLKWKGRRMAWLAVAALVTVLFSFWGTSIFSPTNHSLDDLRLRTTQEVAP